MSKEYKLTKAQAEGIGFTSAGIHGQFEHMFRQNQEQPDLIDYYIFDGKTGESIWYCHQSISIHTIKALSTLDEVKEILTRPN